MADSSNQDPFDRLSEGLVDMFDNLRSELCDDAGLQPALLGVAMLGYGADLISEASGVDVAVGELMTQAAQLRAADGEPPAGSC